MLRGPNDSTSVASRACHERFSDEKEGALTRFGKGSAWSKAERSQTRLASRLVCSFERSICVMSVASSTYVRQSRGVVALITFRASRRDEIRQPFTDFQISNAISLVVLACSILLPIHWIPTPLTW